MIPMRRTPLPLLLSFLVLGSCVAAIPERARAPSRGHPSPTQGADAGPRQDPLFALLQRARDGGERRHRYVPRDPEWLGHMQRAAAAAARGIVPTALPEGFEVLRPGVGDSWFALVESGPPAGGGVYLFRADWQTDLVVEVPHSFFDRHTLALGAVMFEHLGARALLVNTVHRYRGGRCTREARPQCVSDAVHGADSAFQAAHQGIIEASPRALVVAVHGFAEQPGDPDVIVSAAGTAFDVTCVTDTLASALPNHRVARFPTDVSRLGGLTGHQAAHLRYHGGIMLHLELGSTIRETLSRDAERLRHVADSLGECLAELGAGMVAHDADGGRP